MGRRLRIALGCLALFVGVASHVRAQQFGSFQAATPALASNLVVATGANRKLLTLDIAADSTLAGAAWWAMVWDATSLPANGAVTPAKCYALASGTPQLSLTFDTDGPRFQSGIVVGVSTTGCFSLTASAHAFLAADYQ